MSAASLAVKVGEAGTSPAMRAVLTSMQADMRKLSACANWRMLSLIVGPKIPQLAGLKLETDHPLFKIATAIGRRNFPTASLPQVFPQLPDIVLKLTEQK